MYMYVCKTCGKGVGTSLYEYSLILVLYAAIRVCFLFHMNGEKEDMNYLMLSG